MKVTLAQALHWVGVDERNARSRAADARTRATAWVDSTRAPEKLKVFVRRFIAASTDIDIPLRDLAMLVGAVLYIVLPVDLVPDFIPFVGWMDDLAVARAALHALGDHWDRHAETLD